MDMKEGSYRVPVDVPTGGRDQLDRPPVGHDDHDLRHPVAAGSAGPPGAVGSFFLDVSVTELFSVAIASGHFDLVGQDR